MTIHQNHRIARKQLMIGIELKQNAWQSEHSNLSAIFISISHHHWNNMNNNVCNNVLRGQFTQYISITLFWARSDSIWTKKKKNQSLPCIMGSILLNKLPNVWHKRIHGPSTLTCPDDPKNIHLVRNYSKRLLTFLQGSCVLNRPHVFLLTHTRTHRVLCSFTELTWS